MLLELLKLFRDESKGLVQKIESRETISEEDLLNLKDAIIQANKFFSTHAQTTMIKRKENQ